MLLSPSPTASAVDDLLRAFDGSIPDHMMRAAERIDAARLARRPNPHCRARLKRLKANGIVAAMANTLLSARRRKGVAEERDLRRTGWTDEQIKTFGDRAVALATKAWAGELAEAA